MKEYDSETLEFLKNNNKAKLNLLNYIKLINTKSGKLKLDEKYNSIDEYEFYLRYNAFRLFYCGDYLEYMYKEKKKGNLDYLKFDPYMDLKFEEEKQKIKKLTK